MDIIIMDIPSVHLLLLVQGERSFGNHMREFLDLACLTRYPDCSLCVFFNTSLNKRSKARLPVDGPRGSFAEYVELVLLRFESPFTICHTVEDNASPTLDPEPSQPAAKQPESIADSSHCEARVRAIARGYFSPRACAQHVVCPVV